jgi:hypothetical protein
VNSRFFVALSRKVKQNLKYQQVAPDPLVTAFNAVKGVQRMRQGVNRGDGSGFVCARP